MPFDFPTNPPVGTIVTTPAGIGYEWDGSVWRTPFSGSGLIDAPSDGNTYGRLNATWTQVLPLAGGTVTTLTVTGATTLAAATSTQINIGTSAGPNIRSGTGAASGTQPKGSLWMRTDGAVGSTLYVSQGAGTWNAVAGV